MSYTRNTSPFRMYNGNSSTNDLYSQDEPDQAVQLASIGSIAGSSGQYIGFRFQANANDRGMWAHCAQSWKSQTLLASMTCYDGSTARTDQSLMSSLKGYNSGAFNFGDDAVYFFKNGSSTQFSGVKTYAYYASEPATTPNADSNFASLIFTEAT